MDKSVLLTLREYNALPATAEKDEIDRQYMEDEISGLELFSMASSYLRSVEAQNDNRH